MPRDNNEGRVVRTGNREEDLNKDRFDVSKKNLENEKEHEKKQVKKQGNPSKRHNDDKKMK